MPRKYSERNTDNPICRKCDVVLSDENWHLFLRKRKAKLHYECKECFDKDSRRKYNQIKNDPKAYAARLEKSYYAQIRRKFGLSKEQYLRMLHEQNHKCKICASSDPIKAKFCVDHCHFSGKVRGLLCFHCNVMLGSAKDDEIVLQRAIEYLRNSHEATP